MMAFIKTNLQKFLLVLFLLMPVAAFAQVTVTGKVISHADGKPIDGATVSINNSTLGTSTSANGVFTLPGVKAGQYDLIVSCVGYEMYYQKFTVTNTDVNLPPVEMTVRSTQLKEVRIHAPDPNRATYLEMFTRAFLGNTPNAKLCKITNPEVIDLEFQNSSNTLKASSDDYIIIQNKALGYIIRYKLNEFNKDNRAHSQYYSGPAQFEAMPGKPSQQRQWAKNRLEVYLGSSMHFLRSVAAHCFMDDGFRPFKMVKVPNPDRPPDSLLKARLRKFAIGVNQHAEWRDSVNYYSAKLRLPKELTHLFTKVLTEDQFARSAGNDLHYLQYTDLLYIVYTGNKAHPVTNSADPPSTILIPNTSIAMFDNNGIFTDPASIVYDGAWGFSGVADLLPIDYVPLGV